MRGTLNPPSLVGPLSYIRPRVNLTQKQSVRTPIDRLQSSAIERQKPGMYSKTKVDCGLRLIVMGFLELRVFRELLRVC
jgi:hypothetical protein